MSHKSPSRARKTLPLHRAHSRIYGLSWWTRPRRLTDDAEFAALARAVYGPTSDLGADFFPGKWSTSALGILNGWLPLIGMKLAADIYGPVAMSAETGADREYKFIAGYRLFFVGWGA